MQRVSSRGSAGAHTWTSSCGPNRVGKNRAMDACRYSVCQFLTFLSNVNSVQSIKCLWILTRNAHGQLGLQEEQGMLNLAGCKGPQCYRNIGEA